MKKIHFTNMTNYYWLAILVLALALIILATFEMIPLENPKYYIYMRAFGFILIMLFWVKDIVFKNYVRWNNKAIYIRLNNWKGKNFKFDKILSWEQTDEELRINNLGGKSTAFDLKDFRKQDQEKLNDILTRHAAR
ncbi:hypothetical protein NMK71_08055 [Weeksellaceae bacterium KMM 9713]|uniref:Uncharacterized protein n=1 Tax=Profundicola chukchiensis TaxID=2961959 RepID=A0A9X4RXG4_9FLAO|nr:hypothetical protein [Profundicola chukchiensis]MDG4946364.1 hypothetical protein [Profundicola chukchiensis]